MRKILKCFILVFVASLLVVNVQASSELSWYCKRTPDHSQPLLDSSLNIVEKYDVVWIDKKHCKMDGDKVVYLTFDAGYENGNVEKILDALDEENVKGTFFVLENILLKNHNLIKRMIDGGHLIANHTSKHKNMARIASADVVICRAGAMSISEMAFSGKCAIFIPSPNVVDNHQYKNAYALSSASAGILMAESEIYNLTDTVKELLEDDAKRQSFSKRIRTFSVKESNKIIYEEIRKLVKDSKSPRKN